MNNSFEILKILKKADLLQNMIDPYWWPNSGTFEVVIGALLTQQAKWKNVEKSLANLKEHDLMDLIKISKIDTHILAELIKPSGFYNTKAKRLITLCRSMIQSFESFENFQEKVSREWLLKQKGIGQESADAILCYACEREVFVVDNYTDKLLRSLGYEFESYEEIQSWMLSGVEENLDKIREIYGYNIDLYTIYTLFHGMIVELGKFKKTIKEI